MFSKKSQLALALVCVLGTGALLTGTQEPQAADAPAAAKAAAPAVEVTVITTKASDVAMESTLSGRTNAYRVAKVRPQVSGILLKRLFAEGAEVKEGQPLYQIDDATYKAALETAKAQLAQALVDFETLHGVYLVELQEVHLVLDLPIHSRKAAVCECFSLLPKLHSLFHNVQQMLEHSRSIRPGSGISSTLFRHIKRSGRGPRQRTLCRGLCQCGRRGRLFFGWHHKFTVAAAVGGIS